MKILIALPAILLAFFVGPNSARGQFIPQFSQYMLNNYLINPAVGGIENYADVKMASRAQWTEIEGHPESIYFTASVPLLSRRRGARSKRVTSNNSLLLPSHHGVGVKIMADRTGAFRREYASLSHAYHLRISENWAFSLGSAAGIIQYRIDPSQIDIRQANDPLLGGAELRDNHLNVSVGGWLYSKHFYLGISGLQLLAVSPQFLDAGSLEEIDSGNYFITTGYRFFSSNFQFMPSIMVRKSVGESWVVDANFKVVVNQRFWAGGGLRNMQSGVFFAGLSVSPIFEISYAYDQGLLTVNRFGRSTHEILLGVRLNNRDKVMCPQASW
jgi:type IX secretion system PorP/SprF family membrane protein